MRDAIGLVRIRSTPALRESILSWLHKEAEPGNGDVMAKLAMLIGVVLWIGLVALVFWPGRSGADLYIQIGFMLGGTIAIAQGTINMIQTANARHIEIRGNKVIEYFHPLDNTLAVLRSGRWDADTATSLPSSPPDTTTSDVPDPTPTIQLPSGLKGDPLNDSPACPSCGSSAHLDEIKSIGQYGNGAYQSTFKCPECREQFHNNTPYDVEVYRDNRWRLIAVRGIEGLSQADVEKIAREQVADQSGIPPEQIIMRITKR